MIRRDYFLRMIEEFVRALARIRSLKKARQWSEAEEVVDQESQQLIGLGSKNISRLSETELLARLMQDGPTHTVREKAFILATLLNEAGDLAAEQGRTEESQECRLKALHVLLDVLGRDEVRERPEFVPKIEALVAGLGETGLPARTQALLMQHYERTGEFAKAEDALFAILEDAPVNADVLRFGISFYERLRGLSDAALIAGNLPRDEVEASLAELRRREAAVT